MPTILSPLNSEEETSFSKSLKIKESFKQAKASKRTLPTPSPLLKAYSIIEKGSSVGIGHSSTRVFCPRLQLRSHLSDERSTGFLHQSEEHVSPHHKISYYAMAFPAPLRPREWFVSVITKQLDPQTTVVASFPCTARHRAPNLGYVRAEAWQLYFLRSLNEYETQVDFYTKLDMHGRIPKFVINTKLPEYLSKPLVWQAHFQHLRALPQLGVEDGRAMGVMLANKNKKNRR